MLDNKKEDDPKLASLLKKVVDYIENGIVEGRPGKEVIKFSDKTYPTSHGSSGGGSPNWHTIFWATDQQLENWYNHYKDVLQIKQIRQIMSADDFVERYPDGGAPWRYFYE